MSRSSARSLTFTTFALAYLQLTELVQASPSPACNGPMFSFGSCSNVNISYVYNPMSGGSQYAPADQNKFNVAQSTDLASIESTICSTLGTNNCGASAAAVALCWQIFWSHSGLAGSQGVQTWNSLIAQGSSCNNASTASTTTVTVYVSSSSSGASVSTSVVTSSVDATTTVVVNTDLVTVTVTSTLPVGSSGSTVTSTTTARGTKTSTTDTTLTHTITSFTSSSTKANQPVATTSNPFSMDGTPFIYNAGAFNSINLFLLAFALVVPIILSSLVLRYS